ncbi:ribosome maturation factor RimM [Polymorphobacter sp. PAMC 29334]|uniref:ribosome maturation factor RimM n=1 Tax=Polymorphobacter sp. PAMC 29334 TaxID=2862331 RepID=UPI001C75AD33|nr:ribosome maturation factor RimM [Polymorphobacter sp. PAMC 29334]QYE36779.1 ribosome maturation factor RimM [Polymorphobacter sp. PAMC 29334]
MSTTITLAAVAGAHGIGGEVRLKLFGDTPDALKRYKSFDAAGRTLTLKSLRPDKGGAIARFAEIADRNAAEALRGTVLTVPRDTLPPLAEGEYYHADLIGLAVFDTEGAAIGTVIAVENFGAGDILEIEKPDRKTFMVPLTPTAVPEIGHRVLIDPAFVD